MADDAPIPTLIVDKTEDDHPIHGTVPGTAAFEKRKADAEPDILREHQDETTTSGAPNPHDTPSIPKLVVDKTEDDHPVHGSIPGTAAYNNREADAEPDETHEHRDSHTTSGVPQSLEESDIPMVILEKTPDDFQPYGSIPGTSAYDKRAADSVPDEIHVRDEDTPAHSPARSRSASTVKREQQATAEVPKLVLEKIGNEASYGEVPGTSAYNKRKADASPDAVIPSPIGSPAGSRPESPLMQPPAEHLDSAFTKLPAPGTHEGDSKMADADGFDDFDDFGEAQEGGDDDFGDFGEFDEGQPATADSSTQNPPVADRVQRPVGK